MTTHEAFVLGLVWGGLTRSKLAELGFTVDVPGWPAADAAPLVILRTAGGVEVLVTVTETRTPPVAA